MFIFKPKPLQVVAGSPGQAAEDPGRSSDGWIAGLRAAQSNWLPLGNPGPRRPTHPQAQEERPGTFFQAVIALSKTTLKGVWDRFSWTTPLRLKKMYLFVMLRFYLCVYDVCVLIGMHHSVHVKTGGQLCVGSSSSTFR